jgi:conjugal transfer pilus assembly protein TraF
MPVSKIRFGLAIVMIIVTTSQASVRVNDYGDEAGVETVVGTPAQEKPQYFRRSDEGWHFYNEVAVQKKAKTKPKQKRKEAARKIENLSPIEELKRIQSDLENARAEAVLYPNYRTITTYLEKNQWMMQQSANFADVWRRVVWQTPTLDYSQRRPHNNLALQVYHDQREAQQSQVLEDIGDKYGLWFFFRGSCPYCHRFSPILRAFSQQYGIEVMPISLDGGVLPDYPNPRNELSVAGELGVESVPSVYLVNPTQKTIIPVSAGLISADELKERIYVLTQTVPGEDF